MSWSLMKSYDTVSQDVMDIFRSRKGPRQPREDAKFYRQCFIVAAKRLYDVHISKLTTLYIVLV